MSGERIRDEQISCAPLLLLLCAHHPLRFLLFLALWDRP